MKLVPRIDRRMIYGEHWDHFVLAGQARNEHNLRVSTAFTRFYTLNLTKGWLTSFTSWEQIGTIIMYD